MGRVKRSFSVATGSSARVLPHFRPGTDAKVAARGQAGDRQHEPARRRTGTAVDGRGCQVRPWSNADSGAGWAPCLGGTTSTDSRASRLQCSFEIAVQRCHELRRRRKHRAQIYLDATLSLKIVCLRRKAAQERIRAVGTTV